MSNLLVKGYAGRMYDSPIGRTWYKCLVRWNFTESRATNSSQLPNQIFGVLTKFRQSEFAFVADIESMYYQIRVPEHQQSFIKFLLWENHNIGKESSDFAMCANVFGEALSPSCSNYAWKRTATDNDDQYM